MSAREELVILSGLAHSLERIADTLERIAADYALVNKLRVEMCPGCGQKVDPEKGFIIHESGCTALWPDGSPPEI